MEIKLNGNQVFWVFDGQPCIHNGKSIGLVKHMEQFQAVAVLDNESLLVYNYNGNIRFIVRSEGPFAFAVRDVFENGNILCYYPTLPGNLYVCVIDWNTGTMQMKVQYSM